MSFGFCHDQRLRDFKKKKSDLWTFQVFPGLATGSFGCEQTSIPVWSPLCAQRWLCLAGNLSDLLDFCAALYSEAPVPVWASSSLRFLLPTASTNCFPWKSKGSWSNEFSYSVHSLEVSGSLCDFCTCRFFFFFFGKECRATDTCVYSFVYKTTWTELFPLGSRAGWVGMVQNSSGSFPGRISLLRGWRNPGSERWWMPLACWCLKRVWRMPWAGLAVGQGAGLDQ